MARFTEEQKMIAMVLIHGPKTVEELNKQLNIPFNKMTDELRKMIKTGVLQKGGYPTKYTLKKKIAEEVVRRKQIADSDANKLRIRAFIEMQALEETLLETQMKKLQESMEKDKEFTIYTVQTAPIEKTDDYCSSYLEINFSVKDFSSLIKFMFFYGPTSLEVLKPTRIEFSAQDLQDGLAQMADMVQKYSTYIHKLLNKKELEKFNESLYQ